MRVTREFHFGTGGRNFSLAVTVSSLADPRRGTVGLLVVLEDLTHLIRAQIVTHGVTGAIKISARRMRPDFTDRNSFPSGHTSASFASATVLQREFGWKVGLPAYGVASYIGLSRIGENRHYLSDVIFGAAIGIAAGRSIGIGSGDRRFLISPVATRGGGGVSFVWAGDRR